MAIFLLVIDARSGRILDAIAPVQMMPWVYHLLSRRKGPDKPRKKREVKVKSTESILERIGKSVPQPI